MKSEVTRRAVVGAMVAGAVVRRAVAQEEKLSFMTVSGPVDQLGPTLPHEHVMVDFIGAEKASRTRYDANEVFRVMLPHLKDVKERGCETLVECTPAHLGRDPALLAKLSEVSGLKIITNTGYYGARQNRFLPAHAMKENADELAARWVKEFEDGIGDTKIRPGFIKIGVDGGALSEMHTKLVRAAARTHLKTGLTIACHTGDGKAALDQLRVLNEEGMHPRVWIWVHANSERDSAIHLQVAREGGWVEFDGVSASSLKQHVELVKAMRREGLLNRVLLSQDAGWYHVGEARGGKVRAFGFFFEKFVPALRENGFTDADVQQITMRNPAEALAIRARTAT